MIYLYYFDKPKITEEGIAKRTKLRRQRLNMVKEKEIKYINNELFGHYFNYSSPSDMASNMPSKLRMQEVKLIKIE